MEAAQSFDPVRLFGCEVLDGSGHRLGRVTALVHRGDGCDVLVERRHWLRHKVVRVDMDDLVEAGRHRYVHRGERRRSTGPRDGWVA
jgi:hypothetical protein